MATQNGTTGRAFFQELAADLLGQGLAVRFLARGRSMGPAITDGAHVRVEPVDAAAVRRGDILLVESPRGAIAHRVIRIDEEGGQRLFVLKGDSSAEADAPVPASRLIGRVTIVERGGRLVAPRRPSRIRRALRAAAQAFARLALGRVGG